MAITPQQLAVAGYTTLQATGGLWQRLRIPKKSFSKSGQLPDGWENITGARITFYNATSATNVWFDDLRMYGGAGLQGTYKYRVTFASTNTGTRSNANPEPVIVENVDRQPVLLEGIPRSIDPQVNAREIWRTVGNGTVYFRIAVIRDNITTFFRDKVVETLDLWSAPIDSETGLPPQVMENIELQFDNIPPEPTYNDVSGPYLGLTFWCRDTARGALGRVYYSPIGRTEAVRGFIQLSTGDDDPTQKGLIWNNSPYVFTRRSLYQITGSTEPLIPRVITGVPGTSKPFTVVGTPYGIVYQADDGVRIFNGIISTLLGFEAIGPLFRGESLSGIHSFEGIVAAYANDEYFISNEITTLVINLKSLTWRELGLPLSAINFEATSNLLVGAHTTNGSVFILESEDSSQDFNPIIGNNRGVPIPFDIEFPPRHIVDFQSSIIKRLHIDINTNNEILIPQIILDEEVLTLPAAVTTPSRKQVEIPIGRSSQILGVRFTGNLSQMVEIFGVDAQVYANGKQA